MTSCHIFDGLWDCNGRRVPAVVVECCKPHVESRNAVLLLFGPHDAWLLSPHRIVQDDVRYCTVYCATSLLEEDSSNYYVPLWSSNVNELFLFNRHSLESPFIGFDFHHTLMIILIGCKRVNEPRRLLTLHTSTEINSEATKMTERFISKLLKPCRFQFTWYFRNKIISHNFRHMNFYLLLQLQETLSLFRQNLFLVLPSPNW